MKKNNNYLFYVGVFVFGALIIFGINSYAEKENISKVDEPTVKKVEAQEVKPAEKIQVFLFHSTSRCSSCITAGKYAKETVEQKFSEELKSGKIEFREINVDLPENKEVATKFKASGTSLFINSIIDGQDNIKEDTQVWRLISNEQGFVSYLSDKLNKLLGK
ncbi:MAG: hypothetical protein COZ85_01205 [Candidatus Moranbacteria bacterium CG_4_8_14_3_um_filter_34_16]|nr:MAG: hypothetical protein COT31_02195 [Candidatus Moranbacteria bacterium CG08_land_8_20_14_0_20_34_16]PIW95206.1 MAG: hypothetical protein COZ85_01205 [Candidatus Moranbacteria bacterium CG_4_8_14_3_um_filter_34_16]